MHDTHVKIPDYQKRFLEEQDKIMAHVLRKAIDDEMVRMGFDPDEWEETYGR